MMVIYMWLFVLYIFFFTDPFFPTMVMITGVIYPCALSVR
jgi:hypothetical protein